MENTQKALEVLEAEIQPVAMQAVGMVVTTQEDAEQASLVMKRISDKMKLVEEKRVEYTKPLVEAQRTINADFKKILEPLENAKRMVGGAILEWQKRERAKIAAEEERRRKIQQAHAEQGHKVNAPVELARPQTSIGMSQMRKVWTFEIEDISKVPVQFLQVNTVAVTTAMRAGERNIPGIKIFQKETMAVGR